MKYLAPLHKETKEYIYPVSRREVCIKVEFAFPEKYDIRLIYWKRFRKSTRKSKKMYAITRFGISKYYTVNLGFSDVIRYLNYIFEIKVGQKKYYLSPQGLTKEYPIKNFEFQNINESDVFAIPQSYKGQLAYHIFPERFFNGDKDNDPFDVVDWESLPTRINYFGGDFKGIETKIPYLRDLGIKTLFLTPIFKASSNHKYDTVDYMKLDPMFGTDKEFERLVAQLHKEGIRIVLDGVFNHIGYYSKQFQDVISKGKDSPYWSWFFIYGDRVNTDEINYECVGDYKWMPKLNTANEDVQTYFEEVALYWMKNFQIDGWRLDVGDELDFFFRKHFRRIIKKHYPEALIIAETWHNGIDLLRGDEVDSIMNYRLRDAMIDYIIKRSINLSIFIERIESIYFDYPKQMHHILYNLLDSHDTPRFLTAANNNQQQFFLAVVIQMLLPGMPVIYYGDEIGMKGETDPLCRAGMSWDKIDLSFVSFYKTIIELRKRCPEFIDGNFLIIHNRSDLFAFTRANEKHISLIIINNGNKDRIFALNEQKALELGFKHKIRLHIPSQSYLIKRDI